MSNKNETFDVELSLDGQQSNKEIWKEIFHKPFNHLRTGISYMLPMIMLGGVLGALGVLSRWVDWGILADIKTLSSTAMQFFVPFLGMFIAYSIANKAALAPGYVVAYIAYNNGAGYIGAMIGGFLVGYLLQILIKFVRPKKILAQLWGMFAPIIAGGVVGIFMLEVVCAPLSAFTTWAAERLSNLNSEQGALLGFVMGSLDGIDFGGPISKIASAIAGAAWAEGITTFYGCRICMVMVPPLGIMLASLLAPKYSTKGERSYSKASIPMVFIGGYTELALPLVVNDLLRCTIASYLGSVTASVIGGYFGMTLSTPALGIASWFFVGNVAIYALAIVCGTAVTCGALILLRALTKRKVNPDDDADLSLN